MSTSGTEMQTVVKIVEAAFLSVIINMVLSLAIHAAAAATMLWRWLTAPEASVRWRVAWVFAKNPTLLVRFLKREIANAYTSVRNARVARLTSVRPTGVSALANGDSRNPKLAEQTGKRSPTSGTSSLDDTVWRGSLCHGLKQRVGRACLTEANDAILCSPRRCADSFCGQSTTRLAELELESQCL